MSTFFQRENTLEGGSPQTSEMQGLSFVFCQRGEGDVVVFPKRKSKYTLGKKKKKKWKEV